MSPAFFFFQVFYLPETIFKSWGRKLKYHNNPKLKEIVLYNIGIELGKRWNY